jgi:CCR4-NOT transcription complex subunit 6
MQMVYAKEKEESCGVVLAFKSQRFECIRTETIDYGKSCESSLGISHQATEDDGIMMEECRKRSEVAILALLRERQSNRILFVGVTHLFWNPEYPDVKMVQAATLCAESRRFLLSSMAALNVEVDHDISMIPCILMGDFNSLPEYRDTLGSDVSQQQQQQHQKPDMASGVYELLLHANDLERHPHHPLNWRKSKSDAISTNVSMRHKLNCHGFQLASAMKAISGKEPDATTCTPWFSGCLDYIFYTPKLLACEEYLEIPIDLCTSTNCNGGDTNKDELCTMPNAVCPSDHLAIGCSFRFVIC